jgi:CRISPR/Cas system endoribonuclease Cas6 (RAMP superfamily)
MMPVTLVENSLTEPSASRLYRFSLIHRQEIEPHVDPRSSSAGNLQKERTFSSVKNDIIATILNCLKQSTNSYAN